MEKEEEFGSLGPSLSLSLCGGTALRTFDKTIISKTDTVDSVFDFIGGGSLSLVH